MAFNDIPGCTITFCAPILQGADALIAQPAKLAPQKIFCELYARGVSDRDMYRTFNCGVGFVFGVSSADAAKIVRTVKGSAIIGKIVKGKGNVRIASAFSGKEIVL